MSSELHSYLSSSRHHASISPESLELMGKQAANMFLNEDVSLNEGVAKLAAEHPDINHEQVKRVCEFANTAVYLARHDQSKTAGAESSYPQFPLADPARIIQDLSDGARPTVVTPTDADYGRQPEKKQKVSSSKADELLAELFQTKEAQARTGIDFSKESGVQEVMDAKGSLTSLRDSLSSTGEGFDLSFKEASAEYYDTVKRHILDGGDFVDVLAGAKTAAIGDERLAEVLGPVIDGLLREKVATAHVLVRSTKALEKVAHRVVNENHPLVVLPRTLGSLDVEIDKIAHSLKDVDSQLSRVNGFIKEQFFAGQAR